MTAAGPPSGGAFSAFESTYARYWKLALSHSKDRPYAIAGLERRLNNFYRTESLHGIIRCCIGRSLLWQRSGKEVLKEISAREIEIVPSWSWMRYEGNICYVDIPKVNTNWNRDIELLPNSRGRGQSISAASVAQILQGCRIVTQPDTACKIECTKGHVIGYIQFDNKVQIDIGRLGYIVLARHKSNGWNKSSQDSWKKFAGVSSEELKPGTLCYVLVFSCGEVSQRLGVAVIQGEYLSFSKPPKDLRVF